MNYDDIGIIPVLILAKQNFSGLFYPPFMNTFREVGEYCSIVINMARVYIGIGSLPHGL